MKKTAETTGVVASSGDLFGFFHEQVETVVRHQRAPVGEPTVFYLSQLLAEETRVKEDEPVTLVELQQRAMLARPPESVGLWRRLGDYALLVSGFFRENLERRNVSRSYYEEMGAGAYRTLDRQLYNRKGTSLFEELSAQFHACAEVIAEVREETRERKDTDIVRLYEEWLQTGSPRVAARLRELGVVPSAVLAVG